MDNGSNSESKYYSDNDIERVANILGINGGGVDARKELSDMLEVAAFYYFFALENEIIDPPIPASKLQHKPAVVAKGLESSVEKIQHFPRQVNGDLLKYANELGDKKGDNYGAKRLMNALDEIQWVIVCLRYLEKKYTHQVSDFGGNRLNKPLERFNLALRNIEQKFNGKPLRCEQDRIENENSGPLIDFLKICYGPLHIPSSPTSLAKTYKRHVET
jgi:hypothetical protein